MMYDASNTVPAFLTKLWTLVEDPSNDDLICWSQSGKSFHVFDQARFAKEVLPLYFKHSNIASFIRQLNMYGFRKIVQIDQGGLRLDKDEMEFTHPFFVKDREDLLSLIKRKVANPVKTEEGKLDSSSTDLQALLTDVEGLKYKQESLTNQMHGLKKENQTLWREVATLRQKHIKQQQVVNKLIQFLVHFVGAKGRVSTLKRSFPLMLNDAGHAGPSHPPKYQRQFSLQGGGHEDVIGSSQGLGYTIDTPQSSSGSLDSSAINQGVTIQEIFDASSLDLPTPTQCAQPHISFTDSPLERDVNVQSPLDPNMVILSPQNVDFNTLLGDSSQYINSNPLNVQSSSSVLLAQPHAAAPVARPAAPVTSIKRPAPVAITVKSRVPHTSQSAAGGQVFTVKQEPGYFQPQSGVQISKVNSPIKVISQHRPTLKPATQTSSSANKRRAVAQRTSDPSTSVVQFKKEPELDLEALLSGIQGTQSFGAFQPSTSAISSKPAAANAMTVTDPKASVFDQNSYDKQLENLQQELDDVQNLLAGGCNIDMSTLMELFDPDTPLSTTVAEPLNPSDEFKGGELVQYSSPDMDSLFNINFDTINNDDIDEPLDTPSVSFLEDRKFISGDAPVSQAKMEEVD